jgi:hypothetical protein
MRVLKGNKKGFKWFFVIIILMIGIFSYLASENYKVSQKSIDAFLLKMSEKGSSLSAHECLTSVLDWYPTCEGIKTLCESSVIRAMIICLEARPVREDECAVFGERIYSYQFGAHECIDERKAKGSFKKACGNTYQALADYCKKYKKM